MHRTRLILSSSFRLTLLYSAVFVTSVFVLFGLVYWFVVRHAAQDERDEISAEYSALQYESATQRAPLEAVMEEHLRRRAAVDPVYLLEDSAGNKIAGNLPRMPARLGPFALDVGTARRVLVEGYRLPDGRFLLIGQQTPVLRNMERAIARTFGFGLGLTLLFAAGGGIALSAVTLRRVEAVSRTAQAIMGHDLSRRVPLRGADDEFDHLGASVNDMLDRIEELMRSVRQVSNNIAHDLRTPLTRLRHKLEHAGRSTDLEDAHRAIESCIAQTDSILETFAALLRIAEIETEGVDASDAAVPISRLLAGLLEDFQPVAEDHGHRLRGEIEPNLILRGDAELLTQMLVNLLDNAIRHSPPRTAITVHCRRDGERVVVTVADTGPGIPAAEIEHVLRPFYRLDVSRTLPGSGLGLSLVAAVAKRHGATLNLENNRPGLRVNVVFAAEPSFDGDAQIRSAIYSSPRESTAHAGR